MRNRAAEVKNHTIDPVTGFMESKGYATAFDSVAKVRFLEAYRRNGLRVRRTCEQLSISLHTIHHHVKHDENFKKAFEDVEQAYLDELEGTSRDVALTADGFRDRQMQLRRLAPAKYAAHFTGPVAAPQIIIQGDLVLGLQDRQKTLETNIVQEVEAEIVPPLPSPVQIHTHTMQSSTETNSSREESSTEEGSGRP